MSSAPLSPESGKSQGSSSGIACDVALYDGDELLDITPSLNLVQLPEHFEQLPFFECSHKQDLMRRAKSRASGGLKLTPAVPSVKQMPPPGAQSYYGGSRREIKRRPSLSRPR
jgi:hypothetical protein